MQELIDDGSQVVWARTHVGVRLQDQIMRRHGQCTGQVGNFGVESEGTIGMNKTSRNVRVVGADFLCNRDAWVVIFGACEYQFKRAWVVLVEKATQVLFQGLFTALDRFEQTYRRERQVILTDPYAISVGLRCEYSDRVEPKRSQGAAHKK